MIKKKHGSILIRDLFFIIIIFILGLSIFRFQNLNLKNIGYVSIVRNVLDYVDLIKQELFFNKQYLHIYGGVYLNEEKLNENSYKELNEIFENDHYDDNYFYLSFKSENVVEINYFLSEKLFLTEEIQI